jgi:hypothetical protein
MILPRRFTIQGISMISLALLLVGCFHNDSNEDDNGNPLGPNPGSSTGTIDPATGGSVSYGDVTLDVPPGAVNTPTDITVSLLSNPPNLAPPANQALIGETYLFSPSMTFDLPVTVTFSYDDADLGSYDESTLSILRYSSATATPVELSDVSVDLQDNTVSGQTTQFSYMRLRVISGGGPNPPAAPILYSPPDQSTNQSTTLDLAWNAVAGAYAYQLQIAQSADFSSLFRDYSGVVATSQTVSGFSASTQYFWRVRGANEAGFGSWSEVWSFTTGAGGGGGGNLEGAWSYDHTDFDIANPDPFYDVMLEGYGDMIVNFTSTDFASQGTRHLREVVTVFGTVYLDTVFTYTVDLGGTYTTSNGTITTVVTYDHITPSNVGSEVTMDYSAGATDLMLRYSDYVAGYDVTVTEYYIRR